LLETDINYSGTESLVEQPLRYCENPKILYALQKLSLYAKRDDIARIINFLGASCGCSFVGWIRKDDAWVKQALTREQAEETVCPVAGSRKPPAYLRIYAFHSSFEMPDAGVTTVKDEDLFWKQHEIIRVSSPTHIGIGGKLALLFQIDFANEFISGPKIVPKSDDFIEMTSSLLRWLKAEFVTWRGPRCFDNAAENIRIFGNRFRNDK